MPEVIWSLNIYFFDLEAIAENAGLSSIVDAIDPRRVLHHAEVEAAALSIPSSFIAPSISTSAPAASCARLRPKASDSARTSFCRRFIAPELLRVAVRTGAITRTPAGATATGAEGAASNAAANCFPSAATGTRRRFGFDTRPVEAVCIIRPMCALRLISRLSCFVGAKASRTAAPGRNARRRESAGISPRMRASRSALAERGCCC